MKLSPVFPELSFYEKPGCINNRKQKAILEKAGFSLKVFNLLAEAWTEETLRSFFGALPVSAWFNRSAPAIKSGAVDPDNIEENTALAAMIAAPLLIRRPLIACGDIKRAGFDLDALLEDLQLVVSADVVVPEGIEQCPRSHDSNGCKTQEARG